MEYTNKELCFYNGSDRIYGQLYLPASGGEPFPAVILSHGYNSSHTDLADLAEKLAKNGIAAYAYDFRGGSTRSKSDGRSIEMSIKTELSDLAAVIDGLSKFDEIDEKRLFLYGESQGGFVSALTAADMPSRFKAIALLYPAFCIPDHWRGKDAPENPEIFELMGMEISKKFPRELPDFDIYEKMSACTTPTLIFHGDNDALVDLSYSEKLLEVMDDCDLLVYEGEGHGFFPDARADMTDKAVTFFLRYCEEVTK